ncbi:hypothetical protein D3C87_1425140 [compost metagenome]
MHVKVPDRLAFLVQPDEGALHDEEDLHRFWMVMRHQRVTLAGRLVDEIASFGSPFVLQVAPLARQREGEHLVRMVVAIDQPWTVGAQNVGPFVLAGRDPQGT